ncbi:MAG: hypothetical protein Unbinned1529contig1001_35 [Prokaryotic dsDNA virus sp.]|nr:MAG: hypothetical protein Unbinned1529contig1001_35 [Prokaryotic dsDNA virus sp.]|tara:strand:+ start:692 stop:997 length:306 start_codon:yes stop_codon:yes gene_type:complete
MRSFTLTTEELISLVDDAFDLGALYVTDEISTMVPCMTSRVPRHDIGPKGWNEFIESNGGHTLHSGDAKGEILFRHAVATCTPRDLKEMLRDSFISSLDFD